MLMMLAETGHGAVREIFIAPLIGAGSARQLGVFTGSLIVLAIAWLSSRSLRADTRRSQMRVGGLWVVLTLLFELSLGRAMGISWARLLSDYNPADGGFMLLGLAVMFVAPALMHRSRRK
jgi:hypothetical protein